VIRVLLNASSAEFYYEKEELHRDWPEAGM
jgi:hypothetical protein